MRITLLKWSSWQNNWEKKFWQMLSIYCPINPKIHHFSLLFINFASFYFNFLFIRFPLFFENLLGQFENFNSQVPWKILEILQRKFGGKVYQVFGMKFVSMFRFSRNERHEPWVSLSFSISIATLFRRNSMSWFFWRFWSSKGRHFSAWCPDFSKKSVGN